jgi:hypothetical protein
MKAYQKFLVATLATCLACAATVQADVIQAPGAVWEYTFSTPSDVNWKTGAGGGFATGTAPFGNTSGGDFGYSTFWGADGGDGVDVYLRRTLDLTGYDLSTIAWDLGVDNGFALYANGVLVGAANAEGFTSRWEYTGGFGSSLVAGINYIAVELEDHGGATAFDMQIRGERSTSVPDAGSTLGLLLLSAGLLAAARRK